MENPIQTNPESTPCSLSAQAASWEEYSTLHDSFAELLSYERNRKTTSDFWQLNYV